MESGSMETKQTTRCGSCFICFTRHPDVGFARLRHPFRLSRHPDIRSCCGSKQTSAVPPETNVASQIWINVDFATVDQRSVLRVGGWALAPSPIELVQVFVGDQLVGVAETGVLRQDVARTWPDQKHALHSGFTLSANVAAFGQKEIILKVRAQTANGIKQDATVAVTRAAEDTAPASTEVHELVCDEADLATSGELMLAGWAVSSAGIRQIRIVSEGKISGRR